MSASEATSLLENGSGVTDRRPFAQRALAAIKAEGQPGWVQSYRYFLFGSWLNILLLLAPLSIISNVLNWDAVFRFSLSFIAIMPLAKLLGDTTEQLALELGGTLSVFLNASFGNAIELIIGIAALLQGELRIVQTSMLGSILSNIVFVLGCAFLAGGIHFKESNFQVTGAQTASSLMMLSCITLVIPAAYHSARNRDITTTYENLLRLLRKPEEGLPELDNETQDGLLVISRGAALLLLLAYVFYLVFQLKTHSYLFKSEDDEEESVPKANVVAAGSALFLVTVVTSFCADNLVASIEEVATQFNISKPFIGLVLLPIASNASELVTSIRMALKNKMELTIGICVGSSLQIAAFVVPLLVIIGWIADRDLTLFFADFETITLLSSVMLVGLLIQDGKSNYLEGVMLIALYVIIALAFWVS